MNKHLEFDCPLCRDVAAAVKGDFGRIVAVREHSIIVVGEHQFFPGYCMVVARHHAREMHDLPPEIQRAIFDDVMVTGRAIAQAFAPLKMNYASLGNVVEHLHWHVIPRRADEPDPRAHPWAESARFADKKTTPGDARRVADLIKKFF